MLRNQAPRWAGSRTPSRLVTPSDVPVSTKSCLPRTDVSAKPFSDSYLHSALEKPLTLLLFVGTCCAESNQS